ncbi:MAG TPA: nicotinate (nicotinamide) nucleotide adenylyltransferase [Anaerolineales bacterium]|nr:nicotinate (nicotinamide) nucleotide adenylyltransferase [Anaerolineae bacterium]HIP87963.1 nicotinate (nicotinamide) nucleotide adenylyltransferase [Anaerolineales bacterium]
MRLGVLGGTFDPPHYGHLHLAQTGLDRLDLDRVLFVPAGQPPHKPDQPITPAFHREAMVSLAIAGDERFVLSRADLDRPGPHYTADLLGILHRAYPEADLYFLMGSDSLAQFLTWHDPARIVAQAWLAVLPRPGWEANLEVLEKAISNIRDRIVWLKGKMVDVTGTEIRRRIAEGWPIAGMVPPAVEAYIRRHHLYGGQQP